MMQFKKKIKSLTVEYEDGTTFSYSGTGAHNCSTNWRNKWNGGPPYAEWIEHVITFHESPENPEYIKVPKPTVKNVEPVLNADELSNNPLFAGIADNKAFYHQPLKPQQSWEEFYIDLTERAQENGHIRSE